MWKTPVDRRPCEETMLDSLLEGLFWRVFTTLERLEKACHRIRLNHTSKIDNFKNFVIEPRSKILWCPVSYAGSETWYYNILLAMGVEPAMLWNATGPPAAFVFRRYLTKPNRFYVLKAAFYENKKPIWRPYTYNPLLLVRHPLIRILEAYLDLKQNTRDYFNDEDKVNIIQNYWTFKDFVYLVFSLHNTGATLYLKYWSPMFEYCNVCDVDLRWTFILKYEDLPHDPLEDVMICLVRSE